MRSCNYWFVDDARGDALAPTACSYILMCSCVAMFSRSVCVGPSLFVLHPLLLRSLRFFSTCYLERSVRALHYLQVHAPSSDWYNICASARALKIKHLCYIQPSFFRRKTQAQSRAAPGTKRYTEAFVKRNEAEKQTPNQNNDNDI